MPPKVVEPKRGADVGRVVVPVTVENVEDRRRADAGQLAPDQVRRVTVEALVDSGATFMCLPESLVQQLGLPFNRVRESRTVLGPATLNIHGGARVSVQDRDCETEILALPHSTQALLGQLPLESMDFWVDLTNQRLVGNPEHGGHWMAEVY
jgi:clan AA aspartic protease